MDLESQRAGGRASRVASTSKKGLNDQYLTWAGIRWFENPGQERQGPRILAEWAIHEIDPGSRNDHGLEFGGLDGDGAGDGASLQMTIRKAAEHSGYDIQHVRRLARQGKIDAAKKGCDWQIGAEQFATCFNMMLESEDDRAPTGSAAKS